MTFFEFAGGLFVRRTTTTRIYGAERKKTGGPFFTGIPSNTWDGASTQLDLPGLFANEPRIATHYVYIL
jgi:hypothetical protein